MVELFRQILPLSFLHCLIWGNTKPIITFIHQQPYSLVSGQFLTVGSLSIFCPVCAFSPENEITKRRMFAAALVGSAHRCLKSSRESYLVLSVAFLCANKIGYSGHPATCSVIWFWIAWQTVCTTPAICQDIKENLNLMYFLGSFAQLNDAKGLFWILHLLRSGNFSFSYEIAFSESAWKMAEELHTDQLVLANYFSSQMTFSRLFLQGCESFFNLTGLTAASSELSLNLCFWRVKTCSLLWLKDCCHFLFAMHLLSCQENGNPLKSLPCG